jgi:hypothetical protein
VNVNLVMFVVIIDISVEYLVNINAFVIMSRDVACVLILEHRRVIIVIGDNSVFFCVLYYNIKCKCIKFLH